MTDYIILTIERKDSAPIQDMMPLIENRVYTLMKEGNRDVQNVTATIFDYEDVPTKETV